MMEKEKIIALVQAAQRGEPDGAGDLYLAFREDIYYYLLKTVKNDVPLAEDLTQETFMEILATIGQLKDPAAFIKWSHTIAYHQYTAYQRRTHDILADEDEDGYSVFDTIEEDREEFIPGEALEREETKQELWHMVDQLPEVQAGAIIMRYLRKMSVEDIAAVQGVSEGTVKSRLNYGRKALKQVIEDYEKRTGVRLHCAGMVPMLLWLFREYRLANKIPLTKCGMEVPWSLAESTTVAGAVVAGTGAAGAAATAGTAGATATAATATAAAATTAASAATGAAAATAAGTAVAATAGTALAVKIVAAVTAVLVTAGGITAITSGSRSEDRPSDRPAAVLQDDSVPKNRGGDPTEDATSAPEATEETEATEVTEATEPSEETEAPGTEPPQETVHTHTPVTTEEPGNCFGPGYREVACADCGEVLEYTVLPETGHKDVEIGRVEPKDGTDGYIQYECVYCGHSFRDIIPAHQASCEHEWTYFSEAHDGILYDYKYCQKCGRSENLGVSGATETCEHDWYYYSTATDHKVYEERICTKCSKKEVLSVTEESATCAHNWEYLTSTTPEYIREYRECTLCYLQETISFTENPCVHQWYEYQEETPAGTFVTIRQCSVCGDKYQVG